MGEVIITGAKEEVRADGWVRRHGRLVFVSRLEPVVIVVSFDPDRSTAVTAFTAVTRTTKVPCPQ